MLESSQSSLILTRQVLAVSLYLLDSDPQRVLVNLFQGPIAILSKVLGLVKGIWLLQVYRRVALVEEY